MAKYFYHYTPLKNAKDMARGYEYKGLRTRGWFIKPAHCKKANLKEEDVCRSAVYGFMGLFPEEWSQLDKRHGIPHIEVLMKSNGFADGQLIAFKCEITEADDAYVMDMGAFSQVPVFESEEEWRANQDIVVAAYKKYWESRIPFLEYDPKKHPMKLPEAVVFNKIPWERMTPVMKARRIDILNHARSKIGLEKLHKRAKKRVINNDLLDFLLK